MVTTRSLAGSVQSLGVQGQTTPLIMATFDQIDQQIGEFTDRMWGLRALVQSENAPPEPESAPEEP